MLRKREDMAEVMRVAVRWVRKVVRRVGAVREYADCTAETARPGIQANATALNFLKICRVSPHCRMHRQDV
jgi:hypothetical protein